MSVSQPRSPSARDEDGNRRTVDSALGDAAQEQMAQAARPSRANDDQMRTLDFAYRREQLYFEILLDIRDAMSRK